MTRAPFVMGKAHEAFQRSAEIEDTTIGWRFINPLMKQQYGVDAMPETGRERRRGLSGRAQGPGRVRAALAAARRRRRRRRAIFAEEIVPVDRAGRQGRAGHGRARTSIRGPTRRSEASPSSSRSCASPGTITAGNASGVNDGAAAMIIASEAAVKKHGLTPRARIIGMASAGVPPRIMGIGPVPSTRKLMERLRAQDRRLRRDRAERGVRLAGARLPAPARASPTMPSTSIRTAARSRSAIRSACRARGSR